MSTTDVIQLEQAKTLFGLFIARHQRSPHKVAYRHYCTQSQQWLETTWDQLAQQIAQWQSALTAEGLQAGDKVALNLRNCVEWVVFDQAAMGLGLIPVPLYPDDRPDNIAYILQDADVKLLLLQNSKQWQRLQASLSSQHNLHRVVILNSDNDDLALPAQYSNEWLAAHLESELINTPGPADELASIIYTSGTTGRPKGVMLSHTNMLAIAYHSLEVTDVLDSDLFLSFLPLSHTLERTAGYYLPMMAGATVAYSRGIPQLADDLQQVKPTILIAVPRIFERIYSKLNSQLAEKSAIAQFLFHTTTKVGLQRFEYQQKRASWCPCLLFWPILNKLVASKVQQKLGGQMRLIVSGGAALPGPVADLFIGLGSCLLQGYGLTETSPVISVNSPDNNYPNSVGQALRTIKTKVGDNDELLVQGPGNMLGYWNNDQATQAMIDEQGWLHTGDQVRISETGHIYITGRIKDILVLSNGEKVPPGDIESAILMDPTFEQVIVIGEGQAFLAALLVLNPEHWASLAEQLGVDPMDENSLNDKVVHQYIIKRCRELMSAFPAYAKIRQVALYLEPWSIENDLMTPTMKIKRAKVIAHHETDINKIYV